MKICSFYVLCPLNITHFIHAHYSTRCSDYDQLSMLNWFLYTALLQWFLVSPTPSAELHALLRLVHCPPRNAFVYFIFHIQRSF